MKPRCPVNRIVDLKTVYSLNTVGLQVIGGASLGTATAKSDCVNGKKYEAEYYVFAGSIGYSVDVNINKIASAVIKNWTTLLSGDQFTLDSNYPDSYVTYVGVEGHGLSLIYGASLANADISTYDGGRKDVSVVKYGWTGDIGVQIFNFKGVNLIRKSIKEICCND